MLPEPEMANRWRGITARCIGCRLHASLCLCAHIQPVETRTRVVVVAHAKELNKPTNTGVLLTRLLPRAEVRVRGDRLKPFTARDLLGPEVRPLLLYPGDDAVPLTPAFAAADPRPVTLIVPDGNWRQARKVLFREPELAALPQVLLPEGEPTRYALRRHRRGAESLSTLEAVARALRVLEGPEIEDLLLEVFLRMVDRVLFTRGKIDPKDVYGGL